MGEVMKEAAFSLAEAKFASGDFNQQIVQNVSKAQIKVNEYDYIYIPYIYLLCIVYN